MTVLTNASTIGQTQNALCEYHMDALILCCRRYLLALNMDGGGGDEEEMALFALNLLSNVCRKSDAINRTIRTDGGGVCTPSDLFANTQRILERRVEAPVLAGLSRVLANYSAVHLFANDRLWRAFLSCGNTDAGEQRRSFQRVRLVGI